MSQFARFGNKKMQDIARDFTRDNGHPPVGPNDAVFLEYVRMKTRSIPASNGKERKGKQPARVPAFA